jgi:NAD(P)-dependent dehydrogenase (short-subunit alcohol dehydrogenase family)
MKAVLITGVSSGIGHSTAREFANCGYQVFGSVRQEIDAQRLKAEIGVNFTPLLLDVTDTEAIQNVAKQVASIVEDRGLAGLINNAGIATCGPLMYQPIAEIRWQFEVNVVAPISIIQAFLPLLKIEQAATARPGRVINISSVGGKVAAPFVGAYAGSKHAIEGVSHSLRRELRLHDIDVIIIGPGPVNTPIWDKESAQDLSQYDSTEYQSTLEVFQKYMTGVGKAGYSPDVVGKFIRTAFESRHPKSRYAIVPDPVPNWYLPRILPDLWLDKLIGKRFGLVPKK